MKNKGKMREVREKKITTAIQWKKKKKKKGRGERGVKEGREEMSEK